LYSQTSNLYIDSKGIDQALFPLECGAFQYRTGIDYDLQLLFLTVWDETNDIAALHTE
jgi:hypothetical protein